MRTLRILTASVYLLLLASTAWAQAAGAVTATDISRLDTAVATIEQRILALRKTDTTLAGDVEQSLQALKDELTYLKVKLKKEGALPRAEYIDVRDRLETLRIRAEGQKVYGRPVGADRPGEDRIWTISVGTQMDVRLTTSLSSAIARPETRFEATTVEDLLMGGDVVIPAGATVRGFVSSVRAAGKIDRKGSLTLSFDEILVNGRPSKLRASVSQALDGKTGDDTKRIGAGAVVGGIIGGILGGGKGALMGVLVGGGGTMAATEGADVELPAGTVLRLRVDQPLDIRGK